LGSAKDDGGAGLFCGLADPVPDQLLSLINDFRQDVRDQKIDVGVGVYRDDAGRAPVMLAVKAAESWLMETQATKAYLGPAGDEEYLDALQHVVFGERFARRDSVVGVQTPGGTGALRLAADLVAAVGRSRSVWVGEPAWPNYKNILHGAGLRVRTFPHYSLAEQRLVEDRAMSELSRASPGDVVLIQGGCHNPTGAVCSPEYWRRLSAVLSSKGLLPLMDFAYQGLGRGLETDREGVEILLEECGEALVAYSCDKNFGLYRERTGALFAVAPRQELARRARSSLCALAGGLWSMPPDHGAAVVRTILSSEKLTRIWRTELDTMARRLASIRKSLARALPVLAQVGAQEGLFSVLSLSENAVLDMRKSHGVYMPLSGRVNVSGLNPSNLEQFTAALRPHLPGYT
jgi:aromatic-amino-acid transaminase